MILGAWRLFLALLVVNGHLHDQWWAAMFAVSSFYVISGFLITMIMNTRYRYTARGIGAFAVNRALRIYPPYLAAVALSLLVLAVVPQGFAEAVNPALRLPLDWSGWLRNLGLWGLDYGQPSRLVPPAWALSIELCYYAAIGLGLGRSPGIALVWLGASVAAVAASADVSVFERYYTIPGGSLSFAVGACVFHATREAAAPVARPWALVAGAAALYGLPFAAVGLGSRDFAAAAFYANIAMTAVFLVALVRVGPSSGSLRRLDQRLGDLSYPVYLFHWQAGILAMHFLGLRGADLPTLLAGGTGALLLAMAENALLSRPLENLRSRVKDRVRG